MQPSQILPSQPTPKKARCNPVDNAHRQPIENWVKLRGPAIAKLGKIGCDLPW